jgi:hypothetical protein
MSYGWRFRVTEGRNGRCGGVAFPQAEKRLPVNVNPTKRCGSVAECLLIAQHHAQPYHRDHFLQQHARHPTIAEHRVIFIGGLNRDYGAILANDKYSSVRYTENGSVWTSKSLATRYTPHRQRYGLQASDDPTASPSCIVTSQSSDLTGDCLEHWEISI